MIVTTINVNGIRAAVKERSTDNLGLLAWLKTTRADVVCLQETRADDAQIAEALAPALADGWHLEWTAESMGDQVTGILIRRVIDGKAWDCSTNSSQGAADLAKVAKICMSVRKAP